MASVDFVLVFTYLDMLLTQNKIIIMERSPAKENGLMGKLLGDQLKTMVDSKKKEIMFNRSWKTFTKIR